MYCPFLFFYNYYNIIFGICQYLSEIYFLDLLRLNIRLFATGKRSPLFLILGAVVRVYEIARFCSPLPTPGDLGRVLKHLSATHNQTLHTESGSIDARTERFFRRTVGRFPSPHLVNILYHARSHLSILFKKKVLIIF